VQQELLRLRTHYLFQICWLFFVFWGLGEPSFPSFFLLVRANNGFGLGTARFSVCSIALCTVCPRLRSIRLIPITGLPIIHTFPPVVCLYLCSANRLFVFLLRRWVERREIFACGVRIVYRKRNECE